MKVLHVIPGLTLERGGPTAVACALVRHQFQAGHQVTLLTTDQGARRGEHPVQPVPGVRLQRIPVVGPDRAAYAPGFRRALRRLLPQTDIVHVHSIFTYPVHAALSEALSAGIPVVLRPCGHLHSYSLGRSRLQKQLYLLLWRRRIQRACTAWQFTSENEARQSWPWDSSPRFILPNGVEPAEFKVDRCAARDAVWKLLPELERAPYVLFLGRVHAKKRLDILLEAFLKGAPRGYRLVVAGPADGNLWSTLRSRFLTRTQDANRVIRIGAVAGEQKATLLAGAELFALPSEHENFGVAALEATAAGTPVLLTPEVDFSAAVQAADLGFTAPLAAEAWQAQLATILNDPRELKGKADRAPGWVREHHSWSRLTAALVERYRWVIAGCPDRSPGPAGETMNLKTRPATARSEFTSLASKP
jgi:glycosyltransferase involved in cell wall biosynthesis